jgi:cytochrome c5
MKKATTIITLALLVFACSRKTVNTSQTSTNTTPVTETAKTDAAHAALVEQGKGIYTTKCSKCIHACPLGWYFKKYDTKSKTG